MNLTISMLRKEKQKTTITVLGVGIVLMLVLFLFGIYNGVKNGVTGYVSNSKADIWICQKNSTNLLRSSSFMSSLIINDLVKKKEIKTIESILRVITTANIKGNQATMFVFGVPPDAFLSKPLIEKGSANLKRGQIIVDASFARSYNLKLNDIINIQKHQFSIIGFCEGTNATVAQFSFIQLEDAQELLGLPDVISFILIKEKNENSKLFETLLSEYEEYGIYNKNEFVKNNLEEMETGVLPILFTIALLGIIAGGLIITLMLFSTILERREDYALLKALGMSQVQISGLVISQSLTISIISCCFGIIANVIISHILLYLVPSMSLNNTYENFFLVSLLAVILGAFGSIASIKKLGKVYPAEVFRA